MKGLLLKDWYMTKKYCRYYFFVCIGFIILSMMSSGNMFFVFYPCLLCGMIPVNLLGYDERSRWMQYCGTLPYTRAQIVSSKYLIGLFAQGLLLLLSALVQSVSMITSGGFKVGEFFILMSMLFTLACFSSSLCLPFIFKYGVEKGRMAYYIMIGIVCAGSFIASDYYNEALASTVAFSGLLPIILCIAGAALYALSWWLSVVFYKKREIV